VKKVAVTAAVCAALIGSQGVMAEEQPIGAEGMGFAFDDAQASSVQMSELSGSEMEETEGAFTPAIGFGIGVLSYGATTWATGNDWSWGAAGAAGLSGAISGGLGAIGGSAGWGAAGAAGSGALAGATQGW